MSIVLLSYNCFSSVFSDIFFSDEIIANGFHSCESDEDDGASHASSSDWTPRPRIGRNLDVTTTS